MVRFVRQAKQSEVCEVGSFAAEHVSATNTTTADWIAFARAETWFLTSAADLIDSPK